MVASAIQAGMAYLGSKGASDAADRGKRAYGKGVDKYQKYAEEAKRTITNYSNKAIAEQNPYTALGKSAKEWFDKYNSDTSFKYDLYTQYAKAGDPIYDYLSNQTSKAVNRQLAARGRADSTAANTAIAEKEAALGYQLGTLTNQRVQQEIALQQGLLATGQHAADVVSNINMTTGQQLGNILLNQGSAEIGRGEVDMQTENYKGSIWNQFAGTIGGIVAGNSGNIMNTINSVFNPTSTQTNNQPVAGNTALQNAVKLGTVTPNTVVKKRPSNTNTTSLGNYDINNYTYNAPAGYDAIKAKNTKGYYTVGGK